MVSSPLHSCWSAQIGQINGRHGGGQKFVVVQICTEIVGVEDKKLNDTLMILNKKGLKELSI